MKASFTLISATDAHFAWMLGEAPAHCALCLPLGGVEEPWVLKWLRRNLRTGAGSWLMVDRGEVVGLCSFKRPVDADGAIEIGYGVAAERRRRGHATRAVAALISLVSGDGKIARLLAETAADNLPSQRVLEANGFVQTGRRHDAEDGELVLWRLDLPTASA